MARSGEAKPTENGESGEQSIPPYEPACSPDCAQLWGCCDEPTMCAKVTDCYSEVIHWKRNVFRVLSGRVGKAFVSEKANSFWPLPRRPEWSLLPLLLPRSSHTLCSRSHIWGQWQKIMSSAWTEGYKCGLRVMWKDCLPSPVQSSSDSGHTRHQTRAQMQQGSSRT